jgi:hypothetical protein
MPKALLADGENLRQSIGQDHGPWHLTVYHAAAVIASSNAVSWNQK